MKLKQIFCKHNWKLGKPLSFGIGYEIYCYNCGKKDVVDEEVTAEKLHNLIDNSFISNIKEDL